MIAKRWFFVPALALMGAFALTQEAQAPHLKQLIEGRGVARNQAGRVMEFQMRAAKLMNDRTEGLFEFAAGEQHERFIIRGREVAEMNVDGKIGVFAGPAVLLVRTPQQTFEYRGRVSVRAHDRHRPVEGQTQIENPDLIAVTFRETGTSRTWTFEGAVFRGDLFVWSRMNSPQP
jgi:hypothetical protein